MPVRKPLSLAQSVARTNRWRDRYNPLRGLTAERCRMLSETYLEGSYQELMWAFGAPFVGVESVDPDLCALIERRSARILEMDWDIRVAADKAEDARAQAQQAALREAYERFDNLYEAIDHLALAPFRGMAHVELDWNLGRFLLIDPWHTVRDGISGPWAYNPSGQQAWYHAMPQELLIDRQRHWWLIREHRRPIGSFALLKYFYTALSARDWAAFCTIYGIPGGVVIGPPTVPADKEAAFALSAGELSQGGTGYLPHGSEWKPNTDARGTQPFKDWLDWLSQKLVLAGTGGMLTMLNDATGLGSGQSDSHQDTFDQIAAAEARKISEVLQRQFDRRVLEQRKLISPGERPLAWFDLAAREETDTGEIVDHAVALAGAGYKMDVAQIAEKTGYEFSQETEEAENPETQPPPENETGLQNRATGLQNRLGAEDGSTPAQEAQNQSSAKIAELLEMLKYGGGNREELIDEGLALLESMSVDEMTSDLAEQLESVLMEAVIIGAAASQTNQVSQTPRPETGGDGIVG